MSYEAIQQDQWPNFLANFTRAHLGWLVSVKSLDTRKMSEDEKRNERLAAFTLEHQYPLEDIRQSESEAGADVMLTVVAGDGESSVLIEDVSCIYLHKLDSADKGLRIDSGNNTTTLVEFRLPASPESVDGLSAMEYRR